MKLSGGILVLFALIVVGSARADAAEHEAKAAVVTLLESGGELAPGAAVADEGEAAAMECPVGYPVDCGNGYCCDSAHPYCCPGGLCSSNGDCGGGGGGGCDPGTVQCGTSHCVPEGTVCCASAGHEELYCQAGQTCTTDGFCSDGGGGGGGGGGVTCDYGAPTQASCGGDTCSCAAPCGSNADCASGCCSDGFCALACVCAGQGYVDYACGDGGGGGGGGGGGLGDGGGCTAATGGGASTGALVLVALALLGRRRSRRSSVR